MSRNNYIKIGLVFFFGVAFLLPVQAQTNRFQKPVENHLQEYVPLPMDYIMQAGAAIQARFDANLAFRDQLITYIFDVKSKTDDPELLASLDRYYHQLRLMDGARMDALVNELSNVKNNIAEAIDNYHTRLRNSAANQQREEKTKANEPKWLWDLASDAYDKGDFETASDRLTQFIALDPNYGPAYMYRGQAYFKQGKNAAAIKDFDNYISRNSSDPKTYEKRGWAKMNTGDFSGALADFNAELKLKPTAVGFYNRGSAKADLENLDAAILDYSQAISLNPQFSMAYNNRSWAKFKKHLNNAALLDVNKAIELDSTNWVAFDSRQEIKFALQDYDGCLADCNTAISLNKEVSNSYLFRGRVLYRQGKKEDACDAWHTASNLKNPKVDAYLTKYCSSSSAIN